MTSFNHWDDQEDFPPADWQTEVANGDTRLGYADWVLQRRADDEEVIKTYRVPVSAHVSDEYDIVEARSPEEAVAKVRKLLASPGRSGFRPNPQDVVIGKPVLRRDR